MILPERPAFVLLMSTVMVIWSNYLLGDVMYSKAMSLTHFKYHDLSFSICASRLFPAYLSGCVHTRCKLCLCLNVGACLWLLLLFLDLPLTLLRRRLAFGPAGKARCLPEPRSESTKTGETHRARQKNMLFMSFSFTLSPGLRCECACLPCIHSSIYK